MPHWFATWRTWCHHVPVLLGQWPTQPFTVTQFRLKSWLTTCSMQHLVHGAWSLQKLSYQQQKQLRNTLSTTNIFPASAAAPTAPTTPSRKDRAQAESTANCCGAWDYRHHGEQETSGSFAAACMGDTSGTNRLGQGPQPPPEGMWRHRSMHTPTPEQHTTLYRITAAEAGAAQYKQQHCCAEAWHLSKPDYATV